MTSTTTRAATVSAASKGTSDAKAAALAAIKKASKPLPFATGKGAPLRNEAFGDVAAFAYIEGNARVDVIRTLKGALGAKPTPEQVTACRDAYMVGRVASRLVTLGADRANINANLDRARAVIHTMASPAQDGIKARPLRKGQTGRRTPDEHKAVRAAEEAWSQVKAEVLPSESKAQTQKDRNASKAGRAPAMKGTTARGAAPAAASKVGTGITHSELVKPDGAPMDRATACSYVSGMAATLLAFCNKHAGVMPTDLGIAIKAFSSNVAAATLEARRSEGSEA